MTLLENEKNLDFLEKNSVVLTNYRITKEDGNSYKIAIFLKNISSIIAHYKTEPIFIILGAISLIAGVVLVLHGDLNSFGIASFVLCAVLFAAYFLTKKHVITVSSDGGEKMVIEVQKKSHERIEEFITNIQQAKQGKYYIRSSLKPENQVVI